MAATGVQALPAAARSFSVLPKLIIMSSLFRTLFSYLMRLQVLLWFCDIFDLCCLLCSGVPAAATAGACHPVTGRAARAAWAAPADERPPGRLQAAQLRPNGHGTDARAARQPAATPGCPDAAADGPALRREAGAGFGADDDSRALRASAATATAAAAAAAAECSGAPGRACCRVVRLRMFHQHSMSRKDAFRAICVSTEYLQCRTIKSRSVTSTPLSCTARHKQEGRPLSSELAQCGDQHTSLYVIGGRQQVCARQHKWHPQHCIALRWHSTLQQELPVPMLRNIVTAVAHFPLEHT